MSHKKEVECSPANHPNQSPIWYKNISTEEGRFPEATVLARANLNLPFWVLLWAS